MTPKTPAHVMREAYSYETSLWREVFDGERYEIRRYAPAFASFEVMAIVPDNDSAVPMFRTLKEEAGMRAALRALAAMEPTEKVLDAAALNGILLSTTERSAKAYILAAASECDKP